MSDHHHRFHSRQRRSIPLPLKIRLIPLSKRERSSFRKDHINGPRLPMGISQRHRRQRQAQRLIRLSDYIGKTLNVTYAKPTAYITAEMELELNYWDNTMHSAWFDTYLLLNQTSASVTTTTPAWTPQQGYIGLQVMIYSEERFPVVGC